MKTKTMISRFNKVSGYDFNTLKEWNITSDAVTERTGSMHLGMAYEWLLTAVLREENSGTDSEVSWYVDRAKFKLDMHGIVNWVNDSPYIKMK